MPRYELSKGSSNKFWEIALKGAEFTTTYGKIGTDGQTKSKSFSSPAEAKKAYEKLIAEKTKKGYTLATGKAKKAASKKTATKGATKKAVTKKAAPKKAATKKAVTKKATTTKQEEGQLGASASGLPGARYFEFVDGKSSKFWEVCVDNKSVVTRYGKIGSQGQSKTKETASTSAAKKSRDALIAEKTKKGYKEVGKSSPSATESLSNPKLEAAIYKDPENMENYAVLSDWLQEQGDIRGELIALELAGKKKSAEKFIAKHIDVLLGDLAEHQKVYESSWANGSMLRTPAQEKAWEKTRMQAFLWRNGYIDRVRLSHNSYAVEDFEGDLAEILSDVLDHPSGRFVREFAFHENGEPMDRDLQDLIDVLSKKAPPTTTKITFGDDVDQISWHSTGNLKNLWKRIPNLRVLEIETGRFEVGKMVAPKLERAVFVTGGLSSSCGRDIAKANMPQIKHLEIYYGDDNYGGHCGVKEVKPLLDRSDLKNLEYLGLKNAMFSNEIAKALKGAKVLKKLRTLDLSLGTLTDEGVEALVAARSSLKHLDCLDLSENFLTRKGTVLAKDLCKKVITSGQKTPYDWDDEGGYFVSVAE